MFKWRIIEVFSINSLHYHDLKGHKERINQWKKCADIYVFNSNDYNTFGKDNPNISLSVIDENNNLIYASANNSLITANILKANENRRHLALKPEKDKVLLLKELLKQFTQKDIYDFIMSKITY